jgi:CubicO group peptidase (beta-lactamase class C family)
MQKIIFKLLLISFIIISAGCAAYKPQKEILDELIYKSVIDNNFNGVLLIADHDSIIYQGAFGFANFEHNIRNETTTIFNIASLTKQFTAAAIVKLAEDGLLKFDDPLSNYLPGFPSADSITVHHLLTHSSGIPSYNDFDDYKLVAAKYSSIEETIDWIKTEPLRFLPGEKFLYSNSNYLLLAYIIEIASGKSYDEYIQQNFLNPLDMSNTKNFNRKRIIKNRAAGYVFNGEKIENAFWYDLSFKVGSGSLYSTAEDLYSWYVAIVDNNLLSEESQRKIFTNYGFGYGYGLG